MPTNYATKPAANRLQISPNTLRNWSDQYSAFLSESARPGHKPERRFTSKDLTILTYIKQLRSEGMEQPHIVERLKETKFYDIEVLEPDTTELQPVTAADEQSTAPPAVQDGLQLGPAPIVAQDYIIATERRLAALERSKQPAFVTGLGIGFVVAAFMFLGMIVLSWLYSGV